jgi:hypothetical protein
MRWSLVPLGLVLAAGAGIGVWWLRKSHSPAPVQESFPLPGYSESPYLNLGPDVTYVGSQKCAECHVERNESYLLSPHSRSLCDVDPNNEPPDGSFFHKASGRSYRVYRRDGQLRHEELLATADGKEIARVDLPVRYLMGSGQSARTYLVEVDGFLHESPITWYPSRQQWGMSPGYDVAHHSSFERPINDYCLSCHTGQVDLAGTVHRARFLEKAIGCESCHGPGSRHSELHRDGKAWTGGEDFTIVNPGKLPRDRLEAICAACHLSATAKAFVRGRQASDFRPGRPLTDYRVDYRCESGNEQMTIVGHVEQLRQSACYQKSKNLSCLTCHDPHARERPKDVVALHRQQCLNCHATHPCSLDLAERIKKEPADNCTACHMPRGDTEVPHIAFAHHRIGIHRPKPVPQPSGTPELVPTDDVSHLGPRDRQRNLGLAYLDASHKPECASFAETFVDRARVLLEEVDAAGLHEGETLVALAEIYYDSDPARSRGYARRAYELKGISAERRAGVLQHLAICEIEEDHYSAGIDLLKELVLLRRQSEDWGRLGMSYRLSNKPREALMALRNALEIRPDDIIIHAELELLCRQLNAPESAADHAEKRRWMLQHLPK